jgi:tryptophan synthase alpha chain
MNPIDSLFRRLRPQGRKAFIPFLTACDPDVAGTVRLARAVASAGANLLEIGFPYSDPIADGPVVQASYTRALERGVRLDDVFACARRIAETPEFAENRVPLVAMTSFTLVHRKGPAAFLDQAIASGFRGAIVPDLPCEESEALAREAAARDLKLIQLVTPTTPRPRAAQIARLSTGFLYCVSVTGITGERERLPEDVREQLTWLRTQTDLPLCVGFGISRPEHVRMVRDVADGVIVGSALVRRVEEVGRKPLETVAGEVAAFVESLTATLNPSGE